MAITNLHGIPWHLVSPLAGIAERTIRLTVEEWDQIEINPKATIVVASNLIHLFRGEAFSMNPIRAWTAWFLDLDNTTQNDIATVFGVTEIPPSLFGWTTNTIMEPGQRMAAALLFVTQGNGSRTSSDSIAT
jgi:hypothetical protein